MIAVTLTRTIPTHCRDYPAGSRFFAIWQDDEFANLVDARGEVRISCAAGDSFTEAFTTETRSHGDYEKPKSLLAHEASSAQADHQQHDGLSDQAGAEDTEESSQRTVATRSHSQRNVANARTGEASDWTQPSTDAGGSGISVANGEQSGLLAHTKARSHEEKSIGQDEQDLQDRPSHPVHLAILSDLHKGSAEARKHGAENAGCPSESEMPHGLVNHAATECEPACSPSVPPFLRGDAKTLSRKESPLPAADCPLPSEECPFDPTPPRADHQLKQQPSLDDINAQLATVGPAESRQQSAGPRFHSRIPEISTGRPRVVLIQPERWYNQDAIKAYNAAWIVEARRQMAKASGTTRQDEQDLQDGSSSPVHPAILSNASVSCMPSGWRYVDGVARFGPDRLEEMDTWREWLARVRQFGH